MESIYTELALYGSKKECARTDNVFSPISEVWNGTVSLDQGSINLGCVNYHIVFNVFWFIIKTLATLPKRYLNIHDFLFIPLIYFYIPYFLHIPFKSFLFYCKESLVSCNLVQRGIPISLCENFILLSMRLLTSFTTTGVLFGFTTGFTSDMGFATVAWTFVCTILLDRVKYGLKLMLFVLNSLIMALICLFWSRKWFYGVKLGKKLVKKVCEERKYDTLGIKQSYYFVGKNFQKDIIISTFCYINWGKIPSENNCPCKVCAKFYVCFTKLIIFKVFKEQSFKKLDLSQFISMILPGLFYKQIHDLLSIGPTLYSLYGIYVVLFM